MPHDGHDHGPREDGWKCGGVRGTPGGSLDADTARPRA